MRCRKPTVPAGPIVQVTIIATYQTHMGRKCPIGGPFAFSGSTTYQPAKGQTQFTFKAKVCFEGYCGDNKPT
jgi:hypothetical protein